MTEQPTRVVKVGGSLLHDHALGTRLRQWLGQQPPAHQVLIAGGGRFADLVWQADRCHGIHAQTAHWMCIRAMQITAQILAELLPEAVLADDYRQVRDHPGTGRLTVLDSWSFLRDEEPHVPGTCLPESWAVTSDSIAARLAIAVPADELVLLKSALPAPGARIPQLVRDGYVDPFFGMLSAELPPVRAVNLAAPGFPSVALPAGPPT